MYRLTCPKCNKPVVGTTHTVPRLQEGLGYSDCQHCLEPTTIDHISRCVVLDPDLHTMLCTKLKDIVSNIDLDFLPPDPSGRTLESIEVVPYDTEYTRAVRESSPNKSHYFTLTLWYGDICVALNAEVGHLEWWENGAIAISTHLLGNRVWCKLQQLIQWQVLQTKYAL